MPKRCVLGGCSNTHKDGVMVHKWPKDAKVAKTWTKFVKRTREWAGPTAYSVLCSTHFPASQYQPASGIMSQFGFKHKPALKSDAVPSILPIKKRKSLKRKLDFHESAHVDMVDVHDGEDESPTFEGVVTSTPIRPRAAFRKRERLRELKAIDTEYSNMSKIEMDEVAMVEQEDYSGRSMIESTNPVQENSMNKKVQVQIKPQRRSKGVNTVPAAMTSVAIQCELIPAPPLCLTPTPPQMPLPANEDEVDLYDNCEEEDPDYVPHAGDGEDSFHIQNQTEQIPHKQKVFFVYESCLLQLFSYCPRCYSECKVSVRSCGTMVEVIQSCTACDHHRNWESQPYIRNVPAGNVMLSAAMLFSGTCISKTLRVLSQLNVPVISYQTFLNHQRFYLMPAVDAVWQVEQCARMEELKSSGEGMELAGDGRADSPGHSAKYGSYTLMETTINKVVHIELVTVTEVANSNAMEKEGLVRALKHVEDHGLSVKSIVSDRHGSIRKYLREQKPHINHYLDIWHIAKGVGKKMDALSKKKEMEKVPVWRKSVINFLYWCASSTPSGDPEIMRAKWESISDHIQNIHTHKNPLFKKCQHKRLTGKERKKKWMEANTKPTEKLLDILQGKRLMKDVGMLSTGCQTSMLESYHAVLNHFAPKLLAFSHAGLNTRLKLAALHFNENAGRRQAVSKAGMKEYKIQFPKFKKGGHTVKKVLVDCTYKYTEKLKNTVFELVSTGTKQKPKPAAPPTMASKLERPVKADAVANFRSRFEPTN